VSSVHPVPEQALLARTKRQFGISLAYPDERVSIGIGPGDRPMEGIGAGFLEPTVSVTDFRSEFNRCGLALELIKAPGETPDHIVVWFAAERILFCGDNFYSSFPNLYAIRGTPYRDFNTWADTLDLLLEFNADVLAPGHTMPVRNASDVREMLIDYRDAIKHVVAETVAGMNKQLGPDELAHTVSLPSELAAKPYLKEAASSGDYQWALELADHLIAADEQSIAGQLLKVSALRAMAVKEINAAGRNYYLLSAYEIEQSMAES